MGSDRDSSVVALCAHCSQPKAAHMPVVTAMAISGQACEATVALICPRVVYQPIASESDPA